MQTRRDTLKLIAAGTAVGALPEAVAAVPADRGLARAAGLEGVSLLDGAALAPAATGPATPAPWALLGDFGPGADIGAGWRVLDLEPVRHGAAVLSLADVEGRVARVHLCARGAAPHGPASTPRLDFVLMNHGNGSSPSEESLGRVLIGLAGAVAAHEDHAFVLEPSLQGLMPHAERIARFAEASGALL